ncbi:MAG: hypothetical protein ABL883_12180 [Terricaulis sp.]
MRALEAETQELQRLLAEANRVGRETTEGRALIQRAQEFLQAHRLYEKDENGRNLRPDGRWGEGMQLAVGQFLEPRETEMGAIRERRVAQEHDAALQEAGRPDWWSLAREGVMGGGVLTGLALGLKGRGRAVARDVARQTELNRPINARVSEKPIPPGAGRAAQRQRLRRVAQLNEFVEGDGSGAVLPFQPARTPEGFSERPRAGDILARYPPPQRPNRFRPGSSPDIGMRQEDWGQVGYGLAEGAGFTALLLHYDNEIAKAERAYAENETPANLRALEGLRDLKAMFETAARVGLGYAGGRFLGARTAPYTHVRPNVGVAEQTRYALQDYLNTSRAARRASTSLSRLPRRRKPPKAPKV